MEKNKISREEVYSGLITDARLIIDELEHILEQVLKENTELKTRSGNKDQ